MLLQCPVPRQGTCRLLSQRHIWVVAGGFPVLPTLPNPIPAFSLQVFDYLVTEHVPVSQGLQALEYQLLMRVKSAATVSKSKSCYSY